jgi:hypothetical protein
METVTKTDRRVIVLALSILKGFRASWEAYQRDCEDYRKDGYRPAYCFHGTSLWHDYDVICGSCEDYGNYWNYEVYARMSLDMAHHRVAQSDERTKHLMELMRLGAPVEHVLALGKWAIEPLTTE